MKNAPIREVYNALSLELGRNNKQMLQTKNHSITSIYYLYNTHKKHTVLKIYNKKCIQETFKLKIEMKLLNDQAVRKFYKINILISRALLVEKTNQTAKTIDFRGSKHLRAPETFENRFDLIAKFICRESHCGSLEG